MWIIVMVLRRHYITFIGRVCGWCGRLGHSCRRSSDQISEQVLAAGDGGGGNDVDGKHNDDGDDYDDHEANGWNDEHAGQ